MEDYRQIRTDEWNLYASMIPGWLLENAKEDENIELWGMTDFGVICGAAVLLKEPEAVSLKHIYIKKEYRGSGRGSRFLAELLYDAYEHRAKNFYTDYVPAQYPKLERLLLAYPVETKEMETFGTVRTTLGELAGKKYLKGSCGSIKALSECTEDGLRLLYQRLSKLGLDYVDLPLNKEDYLADYSAVVMEDGRPAGLLLVKGGKDISIPYLVNLSHNAAAPLEMIRFALQNGSRELSPDTVCRFAVVSRTLLVLLEKFEIPVNKGKRAVLDLSYFSHIGMRTNAYIEAALERSLYV